MEIIDVHVHIVGNGSSGSGCWMKTTSYRSCLAAYMACHIGISVRALWNDLDTIYVERLLKLVRESSIDKVVILAQEQVYDDNGKLLPGAGSMYVPNNYVLRLAREHQEFLPAVSIHPAREDALDELERCVTEGAVMMKCLPIYQNINCNNPRFRPFWEKMAKHRLPLLAHTGGEFTLPVISPQYATPRILELPLQCGVTVIAAHLATNSGPFDKSYLETFVQMLAEYPNLFGDNSALNTPFRSKYLVASLAEPICKRLVHGSDFPVPVLGHWAFLRGLIDWKTYRKWEGVSNPIERDYQLKRAMGVDEEVFTRVANLLH